jgi:serine/threonine protein phosphatase PrpC
MGAPVPVRARAGAPVANYRADGGQSADFVVLAASVAGTAHRLGGGRCEDSYAWVKPGPGRLGLVVADGVSTAGRGGEGADLAVEAAARFLSDCEAWGQAECRGAARRASDQLISAAGASTAVSVAELSTTLVVALLTVRAEGADAVLGRVGDSTAFNLDGGAWQEVFLAPESDDLHHMVTDVLPLPGPGESGAREGGPREGGPVEVETATVVLPPGAALVLVTDGIANPLRDGPTTVAPALADVLAGGPAGKLSPLALAVAVDFSRRGCQDDRTIVVAWPRPGGKSN